MLLGELSPMLVFDVVHHTEAALQVADVRLNGEQQDAQASKSSSFLHLVQLAKELDWILVLIENCIETFI